MVGKNTVRAALFTNPKLAVKPLSREKESQSNAGVVQPVRQDNQKACLLVKGKNDNRLVV